MKLKFISILFLKVYLIPVFGQSITDSSIFKVRPSNPSSLLLFTAGYWLPVTKAPIINSGHGLYIEAGINPANIISKNVVIGFYWGWALKDVLWSTSFNKNFIADYQSAIKKGIAFKGIDST